MKVLDFDELLSVAHVVDAIPVLAEPADIGLRLPAAKDRRQRHTTRCGLLIGPTWVDAARYPVPDCTDCSPETNPWSEQEALGL